MTTFAPRSDPPDVLEVQAVPGLVTFLDVILFRTHQAELTSTLFAGSRLLQAWIDLRGETNALLKELYNFHSPCEQVSQTELICRMILDACLQAIEKITTDQFASSASLESPYENIDTGRRTPKPLRLKDSWESFRLHCPDYHWADEVINHLSKSLKNLQKNSLVDLDTVTPVQRRIRIIRELLQVDIPARLAQFRVATEADAAVTQRLYLVKLEYRAPLRAFWEMQNSVQRAPDESMFHTSKSQAKQELKECLENKTLIQVLMLEKNCSELEREIAEQISPFIELAKWFDAKHILVNEPTAVKRTVRQFRRLQRKGGSDSSFLKPLLLDLQGAPQDDDSFSESPFSAQVETLLNHMGILQELTKIRHESTQSNVPLRVMPSTAQGCQDCDTEYLRCLFDDWYQSILMIDKITQGADLEQIAQDLQRAELKNGLAAASRSNVTMVMERVTRLRKDRELRFEVAKSTVEEVALRELDLRLDVRIPLVETILKLNESSTARGVFGHLLRDEDLPN